MRLRALHELDQTEGTVQLHRIPSANDLDSESTLILVPRPSDSDPNDPLRWPQSRKHIAFFAVLTFTFFTNYNVGGIAPALATLGHEFNKSQDEVSGLLTWPVLVLGLMNFLWVPLGNYYGKRPVLVFTSLLYFISCVWGALAKGFRGLLWSCILAAISGSSTEALGAAMVNDIYFLHERGSKMGYYGAAIINGNTIGPLVSGFVTEAVGWRWFKWTAAIAIGLNFLLILFFVPETRYDRKSVTDADTPPSTSAAPTQLDSSDEKTEPLHNERPVCQTTAISPPTTAAPVRPHTYLQRLRLWTGTPGDLQHLVLLFIRPWPLLAYPAVAFACITYAISLGWVVSINILSSFALSAPPYAFPPSTIALLNIPGIVGSLLGSVVVAGWLLDWYALFRVRRSHGIFTPEYARLPVLVVPAVVVPAGCLMWGYGVGRGLSWAVAFVGYGCVCVGLAAVPVVGMVYVSDCYLPVALDAFLPINGLKNVVAFGFVYAITPWVEHMGYVDTFGTQAGLYVAVVGGLGLLLYFFGERLRHRSAQWRIIL